MPIRLPFRRFVTLLAAACGVLFLVVQAPTQAGLGYSPDIDFTGLHAGVFAQAGVIQGSDGTFYGTVTNGGFYNHGAAFATPRPAGRRPLR